MIDVDLLRRYSEDRALAASVLFEHRHPQASAPMHIEIMDVLCSGDEFIQIEAFREAGKSTLAEEFIILAGCFRNFNYALLISETYEKACQRLAAIDHECRTNARLQQLFGGPVLARKSIENKMWFTSGAHIQIFGWEQELQSFKYNQYRPDFAFLDDVENPERVRDKEAVAASLHKLYHDLIPAMDREHRKIINSQTRRAEHCMVTVLANNPDWLYRGFPICNGEPEDPDTVSIWPERYPMEWIRKEQRAYRSAGQLSAFLQAYRLITTNPETRPFKEDRLAELAVSPWHWMPRYAIYDPSRTSNTKRNKEQDKSDRYGKVVVSRMGSQILVHESAGEYWKPDQFINDVFATDHKHQLAKTGIEKNSLDDWLLQPLRIEMMKRGVALDIKALQAPQDRSKEQFILGLQPFAQAKDIVLVGGKMAHPQLVAEWVNFPQGPRDIMNALAYALKMFSGVPMYEDFSGANIADAPTPRLGENLYVGFSASPTECVAVAMVREGRRFAVGADFSAAGATQDAVKTLAFAIRTAYPRAAIQAWVPAETYDQAQRIPLVPALRTERMTPYRAEHIGVARGSLSERIRTKWRNAPMLTVDTKARLTLNALSTGYAFAAERGGRQATEPEVGLSRLVGEALECMVAMLDKLGDDDSVDGIPRGANVDRTPAGVAFVTANPRARA